MLYVALAILTVIYMIQSGYMDVKEKKIYTFPCQVLAVMWSCYILWTLEVDIKMFIGFWIIHIAIYILFNKLQIWGAGDSDILLLFGNVYFVAMEPVNAYSFVFGECICLVIALSFSILIGWIESKVREKRLGDKNKVAVVPGFSIIIAMLLVSKALGGVIGV